MPTVLMAIFQVNPGLACSPLLFYNISVAANPGLYAVTPKVMFVINPAAGCHYFPPARGYLPSSTVLPPFGRNQILPLDDRGTKV